MGSLKKINLIVSYSGQESYSFYTVLHKAKLTCFMNMFGLCSLWSWHYTYLVFM